MFKSKIIVIGLIIFLIQLSFISTSSTISDTNQNYSDELDIKVDDDGSADYSKIQDAIDAANEGDVILVKSGIYKETITISKSIKLIGENKENTIIDGDIKTGLLKKYTTVVEITSDNFYISNFTIQNAKGIDGKGIFVLKELGSLKSNNVTISNNIIRDCSYGLTVANPINCTIKNNSFYNCSSGFYITGSTYSENIYENNTVNNKPSLFFAYEENLIIDNEIAGIISLLFCKNITISNISISDVTVGIDISFSDNITVSNCTIEHTNRGGIYVHRSNNCKFIKNMFRHDNWGIFLRKSNNNEIIQNNFIDITEYDWFDRSYNNIWNENYWEKSRIFPKLIYGKTGKRGLLPTFNIDWNPANLKFSSMG